MKRPPVILRNGGSCLSTIVLTISPIDATFAVAKRKSLKKKIKACTGFEPLTSVIPVQRANQLS